MKFKIEGKSIQILGKTSGFQWADWNPLGRSEEDKKALAKKYGPEWLLDYEKSEKIFKDMGSEEEIAKDLIKDYQRAGFRLVRRE